VSLTRICAEPVAHEWWSKRPPAERAQERFKNLVDDEDMPPLMTDGGVDQDDGEVEQVAVGLIELKCKDCKGRYIARLDRLCHEAETQYLANSYCAGCEQKNPLRDLEVRTLAPQLVENQRIDPDCFEAGGGDAGAD